MTPTAGSILRVVHANNAPDADLLSIDVGEIIELRLIVTVDWWYGINRSWGKGNKQGFFPAECVQLENHESFPRQEPAASPRASTVSRAPITQPGLTAGPLQPRASTMSRVSLTLGAEPSSSPHGSVASRMTTDTTTSQHHLVPIPTLVLTDPAVVDKSTGPLQRHSASVQHDNALHSASINKTSQQMRNTSLDSGVDLSTTLTMLSTHQLDEINAVISKMREDHQAVIQALRDDQDIILAECLAQQENEAHKANVLLQQEKEARQADRERYEHDVIQIGKEFQKQLSVLQDEYVACIEQIGAEATAEIIKAKTSLEQEKVDHDATRQKLLEVTNSLEQEKRDHAATRQKLLDEKDGEVQRFTDELEAIERRSYEANNQWNYAMANLQEELRECHSTIQNKDLELYVITEISERYQTTIDSKEEELKRIAAALQKRESELRLLTTDLEKQTEEVAKQLAETVRVKAEIAQAEANHKELCSKYDDVVNKRSKLFGKIAVAHGLLGKLLAEQSEVEVPSS
ncbi:hypothetical protein DFS34DRAFT_694212 [Phlyctochytrium arcticum]|nr:hypothetical protein DFS34DRAFT_694212 [Phlyctochytrium arcticum]